MPASCVCVCTPSYGSAKDHRSGVEIDFHNVTLGNDLHARHLSFGQHLIDKVVPRDVPAAGVDGVEQTHDDCDDEEGSQALPVHLILLLTPFLLL